MRNWLKDALLDVLALVLIIVYSITQNNVLEIVLWVYTALLLLSKILFLSTNFFHAKADKSKVPDYFYHIIYFLSLASLVYSSNYFLLSAWAIIWILSAYPKIKARHSKTS